MEDTKEQCDVTQQNEPSSSSSKDLNKTLPEEAFNNFLQGKRHMLVQDYQYAVQSLATACEMYVKHFGELAIECGEVYFLYGKSLFRLSQQQAGVLGGALNEGSNEEDGNSSGSDEKENDNDNEEKNDSEEKENDESEGKENEESEKNSGEEDNEVEGADEEKEPSESTDSPQPVIVEEGSSEAKPKEDKVDEPKPAANDATAPKEPEETKSSENASEPMEAESSVTENQVTSSDEKPEEEAIENKESDEDDLELAWITLETAKSIFHRQDNVESQLKVADILLLLAEISMESDNNIAAINDLTSCLEIQKKHLKPDDRVLAETYYQMGLAQLLNKQYHEGLENFKTTKQILQLRLENLKNTPIDESDGSFASADRDAEVSDLESILSDIQEKIEDTEELIRDAKKELEDAFKSEAVCSPVKEVKEKGTTLLTPKPVSNITHLLKRKKPEDVTDDNDAKRLKVISVPNGDTTISSTKSDTKTEE